MKDDGLDDVFLEASKEFIAESYDTTPAATIQDSNISGGEKSLNSLQVKNWDELIQAMNTVHTERFNQILHTLPDREFVRVWIKALPFFKSRGMDANKSNGDQTVNQITINVHRNDKPDEIKEINIE